MDAETAAWNLIGPFLLDRDGVLLGSVFLTVRLAVLGVSASGVAVVSVFLLLKKDLNRLTFLIFSGVELVDVLDFGEGRGGLCSAGDEYPFVVGDGRLKAGWFKGPEFGDGRAVTLLIGAGLFGDLLTGSVLLMGSGLSLGGGSMLTGLCRRGGSSSLSSSSSSSVGRAGSDLSVTGREAVLVSGRGRPLRYASLIASRSYLLAHFIAGVASDIITGCKVKTLFVFWPADL